MIIPPQLQNNEIKFVLIRRGEKRPFQKSWQDKTIHFDDDELIKHLDKGGNYGVMGGGDRKLIIVDFDNDKVQDELKDKLPKTFTVKTGSGMSHLYFNSDKSESFKILDAKKNTLIDVQGEGKQVVGAGSVHPNGNKYEVVGDLPIAFIHHAELKALLMPYDAKQKNVKIYDESPKEFDKDIFFETVKSKVKMQDILRDFGTDTNKNPTDCPFHSSKGGKCLSYNDEVAHCFHCDGGWNIFSLVKDYKKYDFKEALDFIVDKYGLQKEYDENKKKWYEKRKNGNAVIKDEDKLSSVPMNYFLKGKMPKDKFIVDNIIPEKSIIGVFGLSGSLKSILFENICCCVATGTKFLEKIKVKKCPVYYLSSEVNKELDFKRFNAIFRGLNINPRKRKYENLQLNYLERGNVSLLSDPVFYDALKEDISKQKTKLLVIDTLSPLVMDYDDNKSSQMVEVFKTKLFPLVDEFGLSIIFVMHSQKTGKDFLGSIKIKASADLFYEVSRDDATNEIELLSHKGREGEHNLKIKVDFESRPNNKTYKISFKHLDSYQGKQSPDNKGIQTNKISMAKETILQVLAENELIYSDLVKLHKNIDVGEKTIKRAIKELYDAHEIKKLKGKDRGYALP